MGIYGHQQIAQGTSVRVAVTVSDQPDGKGEAMTEKAL
jgi:hypothetical protein